MLREFQAPPVGKLCRSEEREMEHAAANGGVNRKENLSVLFYFSGHFANMNTDTILVEIFPLPFHWSLNSYEAVAKCFWVFVETRSAT